MDGMINDTAAWPPNDRPARAGQIRVALAGLLVLGALAYLVWAGLPQGTVYYQTVRELQGQAQDGRPVRVAGLVAAESVQRGGPAGLRFAIADGPDRLPVVYHGVVPDIFGPQIEVVVEGQRDGAGVFQAQTLLAKCPSRFQSAVPTPSGASGR